MTERSYIAIDLKSFYASVECVERHLDPLATNLVVADESRTAKTICLAVSPALKAYGIPGRARLFEVVEKVRQINAARLRRAPGRAFSGKSADDLALKSDSGLELDYIVARPQMAHYMQRSTEIYQIYLKYIAPEDIHVYSVDEVFLDVTHYLKTYGCTPRELAMTIIRDVLAATGITATAGIGPNLYLCKIALDIGAKHVQPDENGVRIAELDEMRYRRQLWTHRPLTDFWRVGPGYAKKLEAHGMRTMGDVARCSLQNEELLYSLFGVNAELLIDHAWGLESCTIADIKAYRPAANSIGAGQVLQSAYTVPKARIVLREMADALSLELVDKGLVTDQMVLTVGYDTASAGDAGEVTMDRYGRKVPRHAHGTANLGRQTASTKRIIEAVLELYDRIIDEKLLVRRMYLTACRVVPESVLPPDAPEQLDLFTDEEQRRAEKTALEREKRKQQAMLAIKHKYGKNAILKGTDFQEGATARERNRQIGGHKA